MARGARGVTCRECGCLNFSSEHDVCDTCRSKSLAFRPTARRVAGSTAAPNGGASNGGRRHEDAHSHSHSKKRKLEDTKNTSNKRHAEDKPKPAPPAPAAKAKTQQPDVIDLISDGDDDEDDVVVQKVVQQSLESHKQEESDRCKQEEERRRRQLQEEKRAPLQSRVMPSVTFVASDFPTMEAGALMRKRAAERVHAQSQPTGGAATATTAKTAQTSASQPTPVVARNATEKEVHPKPVEPRPPSAVVVVEEKKKEEEGKEKTEEKKQGQAQKKDHVEDARTDPAATKSGVQSATSSALREPNQVEEEEAESEDQDPFFQSRVLDSVEFQASDFVTVFDGLAVARRSHPPTSQSAAATAPNAAASTTTGSAAAAIPARTMANGGTRPAQASTAARPVVPFTTVPTSFSPGTRNAPEAKPATAPVNTTPQSAAPPAPAATSVTATPEKSSAAPASATTTPAPKPPAASKQTSTQAPSSSAQASSASSRTAATATTVAGTSKAAVPSAVPSPSPPTSVPAASKPSASVAATVKTTVTTTATASNATSSTPTTTSIAPPTQACSAPTANSGQAQSNDSANVLLPKKKHPDAVQSAAEKQQHSESPATGNEASADADGVEFVKVSAPLFEVVRDVPVEPPVLGYCSPDFLAFMRECGGEEVDEEDDPEEVSRSQLKLLNIVDLTNLSDSEDMDSDSESPAPTPRAGAAGVAGQNMLPTNGQVGGPGQPTAAATALVSGKGTWYLPTLDSERKRAKPEKVMCELCEESGVPSRLIRCPTCTKYYHKKCAKENGDENICWNCELGSMIDDSELDAEHDKHDSEYLAYLRAIRRASSPADGEGEEEEEEEEDEEEEEEEEEGGENQRDGDEGAPGGENGEGASTGEGDAEGNIAQKNPGKTRWIEFIGGATADIDASFHEVTNRIADELRDEEKKQLYSRGFVSREEFEAQMTEVEEYYITEEARLQQLEREKAIEAKKAAEARKAQAAAEQAAASAAPSGVVPAVTNASATVPVPAPTAAVQTSTTNATSTASAAMSSSVNAASSTSTITAAVSVGTPSNAPTAPGTTSAAPSALPVAQPAAPPATQGPASVASFMAAPTVAFAAAFKAAFTRQAAAGAPPRPPQP